MAKRLLTADSSSSDTLETVELSIIDKDGQIVAYAPNAVQRHFRAHRTHRDLILKARQVGISTEIQAGQFRTAVTRSSLQATLAHDTDTTQKLRRMADRFWQKLPAHLQPPRGLDNATTTTYPATGSEVTIVTAGSLSKGRGGTYTHVHGSEVAFWKDAGEIMNGALQGVSARGHITLESTPNGAQGWFYDQCMRALDGDPAWTLHFYPWWWDNTYRLELTDDERYELTHSITDDERALIDKHNLTPEQIAWRRGKQRDQGVKFAQEYPEDPHSCFLLSGMGYFTGALENVFSAAPLDKPLENNRHVAGLDFGQSNDYTVCSIIDADAREQRAILRINRLPWDEMRRRVIALCSHWNVTALIAEKNSIGGPNIEALVNEVPEYMGLLSFSTDAHSKPPLIAGLRVALAEAGLKLLPDATQRRELQAYQATQSASGHWQFGAPLGEHDDTVIALALAWHGAHRAGKFWAFDE